jgi:hypothetical protein
MTPEQEQLAALAEIQRKLGEDEARAQASIAALEAARQNGGSRG